MPALSACDVWAHTAWGTTPFTRWSRTSSPPTAAATAQTHLTHVWRFLRHKVWRHRSQTVRLRFPNSRVVARQFSSQRLLQHVAGVQVCKIHGMMFRISQQTGNKRALGVWWRTAGSWELFLVVVEVKNHRRLRVRWLLLLRRCCCLSRSTLWFYFAVRKFSQADFSASLSNNTEQQWDSFWNSHPTNTLIQHLLTWFNLLLILFDLYFEAQNTFPWDYSHSTTE